VPEFSLEHSWPGSHKQQVIKLLSYRHVSSDFVLFMDADTLVYVILFLLVFHLVLVFLVHFLRVPAETLVMRSIVFARACSHDTNGSANISIGVHLVIGT